MQKTENMHSESTHLLVFFLFLADFLDDRKLQQNCQNTKSNPYHGSIFMCQYRMGWFLMITHMLLQKKSLHFLLSNSPCAIMFDVS